MAATATSVSRFFRVRNTNDTAAPANPRKNGHQFGCTRSPVVIAIAHSVNNAAMTAENVSNAPLSLVSNRHPTENATTQTSLAQKYAYLCPTMSKAAKTPTNANITSRLLSHGVLASPVLDGIGALQTLRSILPISPKWFSLDVDYRDKFLHGCHTLIEGCLLIRSKFDLDDLLDAAGAEFHRDADE
jgi:hypothetical protein